MNKLAALFLLLLAGCAGPGITPLVVGAPEAEVRDLWGPPTARYDVPGGARLEYATGPYGKTTWMVDVDANGAVTGWRQVLTEGNLMEVQGRLPGMSTAELLRTLGTPGERRSGGWQGGEVWSWRYPNSFCLWFRVSVGDDGRARDGAFLPDPTCGESDRPEFLPH
jgi:hypothetical protein